MVLRCEGDAGIVSDLCAERGAGQLLAPADGRSRPDARQRAGLPAAFALPSDVRRIGDKWP